MKKLSDQWQTPEWLFNELNKEFNFDIDLCANADNAKCDIFFADYLNNRVTVTNYSTDIKKDRVLPLITDKSCFMNPPYSNPKPFIEKAWEDSKHCKIVCLVKCDPSTRWWATFWNYNIEYEPCDYHGGLYGLEECPQCHGTDKMIKHKAGPKPGCEIRFFPKRIKFDPPQQLIDSGEVFKVGGKFGYNMKWAQKCDCVPNVLAGLRNLALSTGDERPACKGKGYRELSGPTFSSALLIFDRRNIK